ncbi:MULTISPECIES: ABC transporter [Microbacteriaceae]|uniref:ABC transporter n=2 Tax=Mycetocola reblochoni TaxID=331618 RepID=A0A3L6ZIN7_9MICO|nr:ABC transporter [Mycetocola reblochoni]RLP67757.1 ABC transporter [Mycetocola reblochoni]SJN34609.1 putative lipoprotein [Mycetocola reblochoni REB411]
MNSRALLLLPAALTIAALSACTPAPGAAPSTPPESGDGHGAIAGAAEVAEPPLGLLSLDAEGNAAVLDLLSDETADLGATAAPPAALVSDGRYGFVTTAEGVEVIDSGRWSWDHGDHFHYYLAEPGILGTVAGEGPVTVTSGALSTAGTTGVFFAGSGEAVLLDNKALSEGRIEELLRVETGADAGLVAPVGDGALVTEGDALVYHDDDGSPAGTPVECVDPAGAITTRVGLVVGCADGAVLATWQNGELATERIPYPAEASDRALSFDGRKGRPTVASVAGTTGFWLLDSRERTWTLVSTERPLARVVAVDDAEGHVVAIDVDGRVVVYLADGGTLVGATEPILAEGGSASSLVVDEQRAYVSDPGAGLVHEIDYADGARIARSLETPTAPTFVTEVGR